MVRIKYCILVICYLWLWATPSLLVAEQQGLVTKVKDGDTLDVLYQQGATVTIRLYGIDCPETGQPFGQQAKAYLTRRLMGENITFEAITTGYYGRTIGMVYLQDANINQALIASALAWVYRDYCDKGICEQWIDLEQQARAEGRGLWSDENPVPPWKWRRTH